MFTLCIEPFTITASASAPVPSPVIVTVGVVVYPVPGLVTLIEEIPEYDCGISSRITVRATPCESFTTNSVEVSLLLIVPR